MNLTSLSIVSASLIPGTTTSPPHDVRVVGAPTPSQYQLLIGELARLLSLRLHESGKYYIKTDGSAGRYYPQLNLSFYAEGRVAENGVDPLQPCTFVLQSSGGRLTFQRRDDRNTPLLHTKLISAMGLTPNDDWTFRRASNSGVKFHLQLDGTVWGSNNVTYSLNNDGTVREQASTQALPFTLGFSRLGTSSNPRFLLPVRIPNSVETRIGDKTYNVLGAFRSPGDNGFYYIQSDGSIFYTGRSDGEGAVVQPYTLIRRDDGTWVQSNPPRREPLSLTMTLASTGAYQNASGRWQGAPIRFSSAYEAVQYTRRAIEDYAQANNILLTDLQYASWGGDGGYYYFRNRPELGNFYPELRGTFYVRHASGDYAGNNNRVVSFNGNRIIVYPETHAFGRPMSCTLALCGLLGSDFYSPYQPPRADSPYRWAFVDRQGVLYFIQSDGSIWQSGYTADGRRIGGPARTHAWSTNHPPRLRLAGRGPNPLSDTTRMIEQNLSPIPQADGSYSSSISLSFNNEGLLVYTPSN